MKLIYRLALHLSWALSLLLACWAALFYLAVIDEVNDETDDALEMTSERIVKRVLAGRPLPATDPDWQHNYRLRDVTSEYAAIHPEIVYSDEEIYIPDKGETEPARVLRTLFRDASGHYRELTVMTPTIEKADLLEAILWWVVWLYLFLLVAVLTINLIVSYHTLKPLYALLRWLDGYSIGRRNEPLASTTKIPEFRRLNDAAQRFTTRAEQAYEQQKQFVGNASHEMQTPLAVCRNRLEMLVGDGSALTEPQLEEIARVQHALDYLVRLNKSLLLLSKIDSGQFPESEEVDLESVVRRTAGDLEEIYASRGLRCTIRSEGMLRVVMNPSLAGSIVTNLLKNAFVYTAPGGEIRVTTSPGLLQVCNTGTGALDVARLFERFWQVSRREGSTGLGLSISRAICRTYGAEISYVYTDGMHCFSVRFTQ